MLSRVSSLSLIISVFILLISCKKEDSSKLTYFDAKLKLNYGSNQSGYYGEKLSGDIGLEIISDNNYVNYIINVEFIQGNGEFSVPNSTINYYNNFDIERPEKFTINWTLGCNHTHQKIKISLFPCIYIDENMYSFSSIPSDTVIVEAFASKPAGWSKSCGTDEIDYYNSKILTYDTETLFLINDNLYQSTDGGVNWYLVEGLPESCSVNDAYFNNKGWMYLLSNNYGLYRTKDMIVWDSINNGIFHTYNPLSFIVNDSFQIVNISGTTTYISYDEGDSWNNIFKSYDNHIYNLASHPDGSIFFTDTWDDLWKTYDMGLTFEKIVIENTIMHMDINDIEIDQNGYLYLEMDGANLVKYVPSENIVERYNFFEAGYDNQRVDNIRLFDNSLYFTIHGNSNSGLYSFDNMEEIELGFDKEIYNYYRMEDGSFLLLAVDGLYYYSE